MLRGRVIVIEDGKVALIRREREGHTYYVFPGGGVEPGETVEEAAVRESWEELGLHVQLDRLVAVVELSLTTEQVMEQHYFLAHAVSGTFGTGDGAEFRSHPGSVQGSYTPLWMPLNELSTYDVRPQALAQVLALQAVITDSAPLRIKENYVPPEQTPAAIEKEEVP